MSMLKELFYSKSKEDKTFANRIVAESVKDILNKLKEDLSFNYFSKIIVIFHQKKS